MRMLLNVQKFPVLLQLRKQKGNAILTRVGLNNFQGYHQVQGVRARHDTHAVIVYLPGYRKQICSLYYLWN